jgi:hypothetical protein
MPETPGLGGKPEPVTEATGRQRRKLGFGWLVLIAFVAIVTSLVLMAKQHLCDATGRCFCISHIRFLQLAMHAYSDDNGGAFPPNLPMLHGTYIDPLAENVFYCPADSRYGGVSGFGSSYKSGPKAVTDEASSYVYLPGRSAKMPGSLIIVYDKPGNHRGGGINVGAINSSTMWFSSEDEPSNWTPMLRAAGKGHTEVVKLLLDRGANPRLKTEEGQTILHEAAKSGVKELVSLAIRAGVKANEPDRRGLSPLFNLVANDKDSVDAAKVLLASGADPNAGSSEGITVLDIAAAQLAVGVTRVLIEKGAQVNCTDNTGSTPLHHVAVNVEDADDEDRAIEIAKMLLKAGAKVNAMNHEGETPLDLAISNSCERLANSLRERGGKPGKGEKKPPRKRDPVTKRIGF